MTTPAPPPSVLLTGGTGFIGRHCVRPLLRRGAAVHVVTRSGAAAEGAAAHRVDLFDRPAVAKLVAELRPTHLLHLAWVTTPGVFWSSPENLDWTAASLGLLRSFAEAGGRRAVVAGTCAEYDWFAGDGVCREGATPLNPGTLYGACKNALREVAERFCPAAGVSFAWGRVFVPYGPGEPEGKLVGSVIQALRAGRPARCTAGTQLRDYLYVTDAAEAFAALLLSDAAGAFNVGSGAGVRVADLATTLGELLGRPDLVQLGAIPTPAREAPVVVADVTRLRREVGWAPKVGLRDGLVETVAAFPAGRPG